MYRRAYILLIGVAGLMGALTLIASASLDRPIVDPEGFLGPAAVRLPMLVLAAFAVDLVPRTIWASRGNPKLMPSLAMTRIKEHWTRERLLMVSLGIVCFYITYVCYRTLKSWLPFIIDAKYDRELQLVDRALFLGHDPAVVLHTVFGTGITAHVLSSIYMLFIPMVAVLVTIWLVWTRNISHGYWFVTSQVLIWTLGTATYYLLPTLGPGLRYAWLYNELPDTGVKQLMESLANGRHQVLWFGLVDGVQSVAGFASLHTGVTLLWALMVQYTVRSMWLKVVFWANFGITVLATLYFGWHYVADDVAGVTIALVSFYLGAKATGQKFDRGGRTTHPTTTTSKVPVEKH